MDKKHLFSLSLTLIIVMLFSAMGPTAVYADDGTSTDTPTAEVSETDGEPSEGETGETAASEEDVAEEPAAEAAEEQVDETAASEEDVAEEPAAEAAEEQVDETAASEEGTAELPADETAEEGADEATAEEPSLMEQVPENTEVVVVNAEGEAEPLVTQEAADAVVESDPIWCPGTEGPDSANCTGEFPSFDALLSFLKTDEQGDAIYQGTGTIYVEMGTYGGGELSIDFNAYGFESFDNNDLTIQGGWNTTTDTTTDTTTFDIPIVIGSEANPWSGKLTIRNIIVSGVVNDTGLTVYSDAVTTLQDPEAVTIEDSEFTDNDVAGVYIDADGGVTIERTKINDNGSNDWNLEDGEGLKIQSGGYVTLADVEANENQIFGADIEAVKGVAINDSFLMAI